MSVTDEIVQRRTAGRTTCATQDAHATGRAMADLVVQVHDFRGLGDGWSMISGADALAIVTTLLHRDLASNTELMSLAQASDLATRFFDLVPEPHTYFTNGDWTTSSDPTLDATSASTHPLATLEGWDPISDATYDSGVVCVGEGSAAVLWVEEAD
jgi:hypothetical protein